MELYSSLNFAAAQELGNIVISNDTSRPFCTLHGPDFWVENQTFGSDSVITNEPFGGGQVVIHRGLKKDAELFTWESQVRSLIGENTRKTLETIVFSNVSSSVESRKVSQRIEKGIPFATFGSNSDKVIVFLPGGKRMEVGDSNIKVVDDMGSVTYPRSNEDSDTLYEQVPIFIENVEFFGELNIPSGIKIESQLRLFRKPQREWKQVLGSSIQNGTFTPEIIKSFVNLSFAISQEN